MKISSKCKKTNKTDYIAVLALCAVAGISAGKAQAETAVDRVVANFEARCDALYAESPNLDMWAEPAAPKEFNLDPSRIYNLPIATNGLSATVIYAGFYCGRFGRAWCGTAGCGSFLIVGEKVFEWDTVSYPPEAVGNDTTALLVAPIKGFSCQDSKGARGFGVDPCFKAAVWDEVNQTFMTTDGSVIFREDLSR